MFIAKMAKSASNVTALPSLPAAYWCNDAGMLRSSTSLVT